MERMVMQNDPDGGVGEKPAIFSYTVLATDSVDFYTETKNLVGAREDAYSKPHGGAALSSSSHLLLAVLSASLLVFILVDVGRSLRLIMRRF